MLDLEIQWASRATFALEEGLNHDLNNSYHYNLYQDEFIWFLWIRDLIFRLNGQNLANPICKYIRHRQLRVTEGHYQYSKMFCWEPEGHYHRTKSMVIVSFWLSPEPLCIVTMPFWLSTDDMWTTLHQWWLKSNDHNLPYSKFTGLYCIHLYQLR